MDILQLEWLCIDTINTEKEKENTLKWFILTSIRWCTVSFQVENTFFVKYPIWLAASRHFLSPIFFLPFANIRLFLQRFVWNPFLFLIDSVNRRYDLLWLHASLSVFCPSDKDPLFLWPKRKKFDIPLMK